MRHAQVKKARRGAVTPLVALLLIPLLAMMAFSIDMGYMVAVRSDLQNAADAAAMAGAQQLNQPYVQWLQASGNSQSQATIRNDAMARAKAAAQAVASSNKAGGVNISLLAATDIDVVYMDSAGKVYSGNQNQIPATHFPNSVQVTARRDNTSLPATNGELTLFFGAVLGNRSIPLTAFAQGTAYTGTITGFQSISGVNGTLLPIAVDVTTWSDFYYNGVNSLYADLNAPSGTAWFQIYPGGLGASMAGLLSLDGSKAASQQYYSGTTGWIQGGVTSANIANLAAAGDLPVDPGNPAAWASGPGLKSSLLGDFQALVTTPLIPRILPLFDPKSPFTVGGGNGTYGIVRFVPVYLVYAQGHGRVNMDIAVISANDVPVADPTAVITSVAPLDTSTVPPEFMVQVAPKLSQ